MAFKKGDVVKYLNQEGGGKIIDIIGDDCYDVEDESGFVFRLSGSDIVGEVSKDINLKSIKARLKDIGAGFDDTHHRGSSTGHDYHALVRDYLMLSRNSWTRGNKDFIEVDLHIEELIARPGKISDGEKLNFQLNHAKECLRSALDMRITRVIFIHGVGSGVLRHELRAWLKTLGYVSIENADHRRYGIGATEVRIHGHFDGSFS